ncbi:M23 family metallopeptidase [bacterium]|nr:M23 family metallopeptidase [bacterium]
MKTITRLLTLPLFLGIAVSAAAQDDVALSSPVPGHEIVSGFGERKNPYTGELMHHNAVDIGAPAGTPVLAPADGEVITTGEDKACGLFIIISHSDDLVTKYAHLDAIAVHVGENVTSGGNIGTVGATGLATGPHLHFEVKVKGKCVDPEDFLK